MGTNNKPQSVKTTDTVFDIVEALRDHNGARVTELADDLGLAKSTVYRHLTSLHEREYVTREGDEYYLGFRFLALGEHTRQRRQEYRLVREKVGELADETNERVQFAVEEHGKAVHVFREIGDNAVRTDWEIGKRVGLHETACGKAILAFLPDGRIHEVIDRHGLTASTENTITDQETLFEDLAAIRERGYAINREEFTDSLNAIGVPVHDQSGTVFGSISVSGPAHRMKGDRFEEDIPDLMLGVANEIEINSRFL